MREFEDYHKLFHESTLRFYYISTPARIGFIWKKDLKNNKGRMDERLIQWVDPKTIIRNKLPLLSIVIDSDRKIVKNLMAKHFIEGYKFKDHIVDYRDDNYLNCKLSNLMLVSRHKRLSDKAAHRRTMIIAVKKKFEGQWTHYRSIKEAAEALYVFNDTLANYLNRKTHYSVLQDYDFKINGVEFIPRKRTGSNYRIKMGFK